MGTWQMYVIIQPSKICSACIENAHLCSFQYHHLQHSLQALPPFSCPVPDLIGVPFMFLSANAHDFDNRRCPLSSGLATGARETKTADVELEISVDIDGQTPRLPWVRDSDELRPERLNENKWQVHQGPISRTSFRSGLSYQFFYDVAR